MIEYKRLYCNYLIKDKLVIQYEFQRDAVEEIEHTADVIEYKRLRHVKISGWLDKQKNSHKQRTSPEYKSNRSYVTLHSRPLKARNVHVWWSDSWQLFKQLHYNITITAILSGNTF